MLNYIWSALVALSIGCSIIMGNASELSKAIVDSSADAISLIITMAGVMTLWSGIMKIAEESGFTELMATVMSPVLKRLFPRLNPKSEAFHGITMNVTANLLGLGNTATPFGLKAMSELNRLNGESSVASDEMVIFVVMNTASLQLVPTMLGALRQSYGSAAPFEVLTPIWIGSAAALSVGLIIAVSSNKIKRG